MGKTVPDRSVDRSNLYAAKRARCITIQGSGPRGLSRAALTLSSTPGARRSPSGLAGAGQPQRPGAQPRPAVAREPLPLLSAVISRSIAGIMETSILDPAQIKRLRVLQQREGSRVRIFEDLSDIFARDSQSYVRALQAAIETGDEQESSRLLHALKGAALGIGARQVAQRCLELEQEGSLPTRDAVFGLETLAETAHVALRAAQNA